jgi:EmrB/QacA subfamily drug resistance transporter
VELLASPGGFLLSASGTRPEEPDLKEENRKWWTLVAVSFGLFMIMLDNTVVNVSLPSMQRSLGLDLAELEWIVTGYALAFGALMLTGGKLADLFGRRLMFVIGLVIFTLASLACGLAGTAAVLIGARVVQGVGGALMNPATLSIITVAFPVQERGRAIGIWVGVSAMALAIGPLVGGIISQHIDWSWIFFINVPIGAIAIVVAFLFIDESRDTSHEQRADIPGLITSGVGLFALTYALIEGNQHGWATARIAVALVVAVVGLVAFYFLERHQRIPMLDFSLFRDRTFAGANTVTLLSGLSTFGVFFYVSLYMQQVLHYSPTKTGATFLPMTLLIIVVAPRAGRLADQVGAKPLIVIGQLMVCAALLLYARLSESSGLFSVLVPMVLSGAGMALTGTPATTAAMASVQRDKAGIGSAVLSSARQVGGSVGIALMGAVVGIRMTASLANGTSNNVAFISGIRSGFILGAFFALCAAIVAWRTIGLHGEAGEDLGIDLAA